jgi:formylglycine-generating enzyme required for sulfatase activity
MTNGDVVQSVFQLRSKMIGLIDWARRNGKSDLSSLRALAKVNLIPYSTLQSNIHAERMAVINQTAIANAFGFDVNWVEWRDPDAPRMADASIRVDHAGAFLRKFTAHKAIFGGSRILEGSGHADGPPQSVAPNRRLAVELDRVALSAQNLVAELKKTNFEIGYEFPKQRLVDIADTLTSLSAGSENGALPALEYAEGALNEIRFSSVEITYGDALPDFGRGGRVDQALGALISDVGTAKRFYSQSTLEAAAKSQMPDNAIAEISHDRGQFVDRAQAISRAGFDVANDLGKSASDLVASHDPDHVAADNLSRKSRDVANLTRQEGIEISSTKPRIAWLEKLENGLTQALRGFELAAALGEIASRKIGQVLIGHMTEWFKGAREFAEESRGLVASLKKKWRAENDAEGPVVQVVHRSTEFRAPRMVVVPEGDFIMGSPDSEAYNEERPRHKVTFKTPFAVGISPIMKGEFASFVEATNYKMDEGSTRSWRKPGFDQEDDHPVICVSWHDAKAYVAWLKKESGNDYRLLSEAEWEYCCRAGTMTKYSTGDSITVEQANFGNAKGTTSVFKFLPNPLGLYDMHGNVWEWCEDNWHPTYDGAPQDGSVWQSGDESLRVLRGGSWNRDPDSLRSASRVMDQPGLRLYVIGFRVARTL